MVGTSDPHPARAYPAAASTSRHGRSPGASRSVRLALAFALATICALATGCRADVFDRASRISDSPVAVRDLGVAIRSGLAAQLELGPQIGADYSGLRAVLVTIGGATVFERYYACTADDTHDLGSVTGTVLSTLVGIAIGEGRLGLDDPLSTLLPDLAPAMPARTAEATLRQVLTMTAGFAAQSPAGWPTLLSAGDAARDILRAADAPPGKRFQYSDDSAHLVSAILEQATGMPILDYARTRLFEPLGITTEPAFTPTVGRAVLDDDARVRLLLTEYARAGFAWWLDPQGHAMGWGSLKLRPRDLARLGRLYLDGGRRDGVQVVPAGWTREATVDQSAVPIWDSSGVGYGYGWWVRSAGGDRAYAATGYGGQLIEVVPALDLVVVTVADRDRLDATDQGVSTILMTSLAESVVAAAVRGNR